jgi:hypothetical protein
MPPAGGKRTSLASYSWGNWGEQSDLGQFREVFQPAQGIFSPSYPLSPTQAERVRLWDFPVGYNTIYTPRSYEVPANISQGLQAMLAGPSVANGSGAGGASVIVNISAIDSQDVKRFFHSNGALLVAALNSATRNGSFLRTA